MVHDVETVRKFYEGSGRDEPIPWEVWRSVIGMWTPFICALFLMMISFMAILRKQWIEHERLIYPLMQVPLAMTEEGEDDQKLSPFFKNPVMWAGFAIPALWGTLHGLYNYFPEIIPIAQNVDPIRMDVTGFPPHSRPVCRAALQHHRLLLFSQDRYRLQPVVFQSALFCGARHFWHSRRGQ